MTVSIVNLSRGIVVCTAAKVADHFLSRLQGLLGKRVFGPEDGLLLRPCASVHTLGMAFAIDVIALDRDLRVQAIRACLQPWRGAIFPRATQRVLELPAGQSGRACICVGDQLAMQ